MNTMLELEWIKCNESKNWCGLKTVNLASSHFDDLAGVYVIWHGGQNPKVVRVGQGNIKDRLAAHREDREILAYDKHGLYATWAEVPESKHDGVEAYLADLFSPLVGERFPDVRPISVNSPFKN